MPKLVTRVMKMPYARQALRTLRFERSKQGITDDPPISEVQKKAELLEFKAWIKQEVMLCNTYAHVLDRRREIIGK